MDKESERRTSKAHANGRFAKKFYGSQATFLSLKIFRRIRRRILRGKMRAGWIRRRQHGGFIDREGM